MIKTNKDLLFPTDKDRMRSTNVNDARRYGSVWSEKGLIVEILLLLLLLFFIRSAKCLK